VVEAPPEAGEEAPKEDPKAKKGKKGKETPKKDAKRKTVNKGKPPTPQAAAPGSAGGDAPALPQLQHRLKARVRYCAALYGLPTFRMK